MHRVSYVVRALGWRVRCPRGEVHDGQICHWNDVVGPKTYTPLLTIEDAPRALDKEGKRPCSSS